MADLYESPDESTYRPLQIPPPGARPSGVRRAANLIALIIVVLVTGCPVAMFIALMYQRWQNVPYNTIHWSGVFAFAIAYIVITIACMIFFIIRSKRA